MFFFIEGKNFIDVIFLIGCKDKMLITKYYACIIVFSYG